MDIRPPKPQIRPKTAPQRPLLPLDLPPVTHEGAPTSPPLPSSKKKLKKPLIVTLAVMLTLAVLAAAAVLWYSWSLSPHGGQESTQRVAVASGDGLSSIGDDLEKRGLIRSSVAFQIYGRLHGDYRDIKAGGYIISNNQSVKTILDMLTRGEHGTFRVTILPGMTLKQLADPSVENSLADQGYSQHEIEQAFDATYRSKLLADKPAGASLEGYIYPETYQVSADETLQDVFERTFDELYSKLQRDGLLERFSAQGLTLHQAITLASIVQKEVSNETDQKQVAQVFLKRYKESMVLGSDVTFIYAAEQDGVTPTVDYDSPYNTRKYPWLPPGPIANMNYSALRAVANPAEGDFLYFVAGDDGHTYFSRTEAEHDAAVAAHCHVLCGLY